MFEDNKEKSSSNTWDLSNPWAREADLLWAVKDGFFTDIKKLSRASKQIFSEYTCPNMLQQT